MSPFQPKIKAYSGNAKWRSRVFPRIFPQLKWRHSCFYHSTERHVSHVLFVNYKKDRINTKMKLKDTTKPFAEFSNLNTPLSFRYGRGRYCVLLCIVYFSPNLILTFYQNELQHLRLFHSPLVAMHRRQHVHGVITMLPKKLFRIIPCLFLAMRNSGTLSELLDFKV